MKLALVVAMVAGTNFSLPRCTRYGIAEITAGRAEFITCMYNERTGSIWQQIDYPGRWYWMPLLSLPIPKELQ